MIQINKISRGVSEWRHWPEKGKDGKNKSADLRGGRSALLLDARKQNEHILSVITDKNKKMQIL